MKRFCLTSALFAVVLLASMSAHAEEYVISIKNNQFQPRELTVPAGQKVKVTIKNLDSTPAEFESSDLNREKVVTANSQIIVYIGPLETGSYGYFDDFHRDTTTGTILAK